MGDLRHKTLSGVRWMAISQVVSQVARFLIAALLARLVTPPEFGLFQMATVFTSFASLLCDVGLGAALIQQPQLDERQLSATFWLNTGISAILLAVLSSAAGALASVYHQPAVALLVRVVSADFVLAALAIVHRALLIREMNYRALARAEIAASLVGGVAALAAAWQGAGVWSLAVLVLTTTGTSTVMLWLSRNWRPSWRGQQAVSGHILGFGLNLQGFNVINYWLRNLDKFLIGRMFGDVQLGQYSRAYTTMLLPQTQLIGVLERVMWPALARCNQNRPRLRDVYCQALRLVCFVAFPALAGMLATAAEFVHVLYGPRWADCVPALRWLCVAGLAQAPVATAGWLYLATGRTRRLLGWGAGAGVFIVAGTLAGIAMGSIESVAMMYALTSTLLLPAAFLVAAPCVELPLRRVAQAIGGNLALSLVMAAAVWLLRGALPASLSPLLRFLACVTAGAVIYGGLAVALRLPAARDLVTVLRDLRRKPAPAVPAEATS